MLWWRESFSAFFCADQDRARKRRLVCAPRVANRPRRWGTAAVVQYGHDQIEVLERLGEMRGYVAINPRRPHW